MTDAIRLGGVPLSVYNCVQCVPMSATRRCSVTSMACNLEIRLAVKESWHQPDCEFCLAIAVSSQAASVLTTSRWLCVSDLPVSPGSDSPCLSVCRPGPVAAAAVRDGQSPGLVSLVRSLLSLGSTGRCSVHLPGPAEHRGAATGPAAPGTGQPRQHLLHERRAAGALPLRPVSRRDGGEEWR